MKSIFLIALVALISMASVYAQTATQVQVASTTAASVTPSVTPVTVKVMEVNKTITDLDGSPKFEMGIIVDNKEVARYYNNTNPECAPAISGNNVFYFSKTRGSSYGYDGIILTLSDGNVVKSDTVFKDQNAGFWSFWSDPNTLNLFCFSGGYKVWEFKKSGSQWVYSCKAICPKGKGEAFSAAVKTEWAEKQANPWEKHLSSGVMIKSTPKDATDVVEVTKVTKDGMVHKQKLN